MPNQFQTLFAGSFDTFKVFDNLTLTEMGNTPFNFPKTIWQILNHLTKWQAYQLVQIRNTGQSILLHEEDTWIAEQQPTGQEALDQVISTFNHQQDVLVKELSVLDDKDPKIGQKLKLVQDLSVHLSFHMGEVVLMRRLAGNYPLPHQMKAFLN